MSLPEPPQTMQPPSPTQDIILPPRNLVLCFDGTGNQFIDDRNTNVVHLFQMLKRDSPDEQLVYYQTGLGTYVPPGFGLLGARIAELLDNAVALFLEDHVLGGYKFLMETYRKGDKISLFGFSRGAYTARALAAMLYRVGLLPLSNFELVPFAYKIFKESKKENAIMKKDPNNPKGYLSKNFRDTFSRKVIVDFVGIWDTVSSVGLIPRSLPNTAKNPIVKHVRHALALDERRVKFKAAPWSTLKEEDPYTVDDTKKDQEGLPGKARTVKEVWFAGGHGDVGGGWVPYKEKAALSRIPLRWIIREATEHSSIRFEESFLETFRVRKPTDPKSLADYVEAEKADALSPWHSAFGWNNLWWMLEVIPMLAYLQFMGYFVGYLQAHLFRPRKIRKPKPKYPTIVHSSVKTRLQHYRDDWGRPYRNAAKWKPDLTVFEDEWALPNDVLR